MLLLLDHFLLVYLKLKVLILGGTIMSNHQRLISFDGTMNFRDLGGYQNTDGQTVKWQKIYRSDSLSNLSANDLKKFKNACSSSNFSKFISIANDVVSFDKEIENLFMSHNVSKEDLEEVEQMMDKVHDKLSELMEKSPLLETSSTQEK